MLPLLPFVVGFAAGALAIQLWRNQSARASMDKAQDKMTAAASAVKEKLRHATLSKLEAIEHSSAKMRVKLSGTDKTTAAPRAAQHSKRAAAKKTARKVGAAAKSVEAAKAATPAEVQTETTS